MRAGLFFAFVLYAVFIFSCTQIDTPDLPPPGFTTDSSSSSEVQ